jgi:hypothetical protein
VIVRRLLALNTLTFEKEFGFLSVYISPPPLLAYRFPQDNASSPTATSTI